MARSNDRFKSYCHDSFYGFGERLSVLGTRDFSEKLEQLTARDDDSTFSVLQFPVPFAVFPEIILS